MRSDRDHVVLQTGLKCYCGENGIRWMRCRIEGCLVATCMGHQMSMERERDIHEAAHKAAP